MGAVSTIENTALATINERYMVSQVESWAAVNSFSHNPGGLAIMAAMLTHAFMPLGALIAMRPAAATRMRPNGTEEALPLGYNLHMSVRPHAATRVLLTGHYDTVYAPDHPFQSAQWLPDGTLNGPGVTDMKGGIAVMLAALRAFETSPYASGLGYEIILNADEEISSPGSAPLLAQAARRVQAGLVFEPALPDGTLAGGRPGSGNFSIHIAGRAAHAGREPEKGRNAIIAACDLALRLAALAGPDLGVNVARIDGGGPNNIVPDTAVLRVNMRPNHAESEARASAVLDAAMQTIAADHEVRVHPHGGFGRPPKPLDSNQHRLFDLVRATGADLGLPIQWQTVGGVCDGNNLAATGLAVVDSLGVRGGNIHSAQEYLIPASLAERARLAALLLMRLAQTGFTRA